MQMITREIKDDGNGPDTEQFHDYRLVNKVFELEMDRLREELDSLLSHGPDGAPWDVGANWVGDLVVRFTRDLAWDEAKRVQRSPHCRRARTRRTVARAYRARRPQRPA